MCENWHSFNVTKTRIKYQLRKLFRFVTGLFQKELETSTEKLKGEF